MSIKFNPILGTLLVVVATILLHVSDAWGGLKEVPGWKPIPDGNLVMWKPISSGWDPIANITDEVIELGKFAVNEHNKEAKTNLEFQEVLNAESKVIEGIKYALAISAKDGDLSHIYVAMVLVKPKEKSRNLISFEKCEELGEVTKCSYT